MQTAPFSSSYNLTWTPEQVATIRKTSFQNTRDAMGVLRNAVRETYELKKAGSRVVRMRESLMMNPDSLGIGRGGAP